MSQKYGFSHMKHPILFVITNDKTEIYKEKEFDFESISRFLMPYSKIKVERKGAVMHQKGEILLLNEESYRNDKLCHMDSPEICIISLSNQMTQVLHQLNFAQMYAKDPVIFTQLPRNQNLARFISYELVAFKPKRGKFMGLSPGSDEAAVRKFVEDVVSGSGAWLNC